ncbi:MAG: hypothetical protein P8J32_01700 [bacterium]|jgi:hypothetical protein|nr:hypothetical protein [bacterium]
MKGHQQEAGRDHEMADQNIPWLQDHLDEDEGTDDGDCGKREWKKFGQNGRQKAVVPDLQAHWTGVSVSQGPGCPEPWNDDQAEKRKKIEHVTSEFVTNKNTTKTPFCQSI